VVVGVIVLLLTLNTIVRTTVESVATDSVQQPTTLQAADLSIVGGKLGLTGLAIKNPQGFAAADFVELKQIDIAVQSSSLLSDTMVVTDLTLTDLKLSIEQSGLKNNLKEIMSQIQKQRDKTSSSRRLKIDTLTLKNTQVSLHMGLDEKNSRNVTVTIPEMVMKDPTNSDGQLMKVADLMGKILVEVVVQAKNDASVPPEIKALVDSSFKFVGSDMKKLLGDFGNGAATQAGKPVQEVFKGVGDLFKKKQTQEK